MMARFFLFFSIAFFCLQAMALNYDTAMTHDVNYSELMKSGGYREQTKQGNSALIFISFSMPRESIIAYLRDANAIHASVVIRGLVNNSFKDTFRVMAELVKASNGGGVELNPVAFEQFHIKRVPSVVVLPMGSNCLSQSSCQAEKDYDQMSGSITLEAALMEIRNHGQVAAEEASIALAKLQGNSHV